MIESGEWEILGNDKNPCIHPGARLAPLTNLEPCEEPVNQTGLTGRETTARKKTISHPPTRAITATASLSCLLCGW